jgi:hypothetical protein
MSTTIKSSISERTLTIANNGACNGLVNVSFSETIKTINVNPADLLTALRTEGVLDADDGAQEKLDALRGRIEALIKDRDARGFNKTATGAIREALNPPAPYQFPTGLGAVVEGEYSVDGMNETGRTHRIIFDGDWWWKVGVNSTGSSATTIAKQYTNLRTLSEGVTL